MTINCSDVAELNIALHNLRVLGWTIEVGEHIDDWIATAKKSGLSCLTQPTKSEYLASRAVVHQIMKL